MNNVQVKKVDKTLSWGFWKLFTTGTYAIIGTTSQVWKCYEKYHKKNFFLTHILVGFLYDVSLQSEKTTFCNSDTKSSFTRGIWTKLTSKWFSTIKTKQEMQRKRNNHRYIMISHLNIRYLGGGYKRSKSVPS